MTQEKSPPRPAGLSGAGLAAWPGNRATTTTTQPHCSTTRLACQDPHAGGDLAALALDAIRKAEAARFMAEVCRVAGDRAGWEYHRRQLLAHQAIAWQAGHPQRQPQEVTA